MSNTNIFPEITRATAEEKLKSQPVGSWLLRQSSVKTKPNDTLCVARVLSYRAERNIEHRIIIYIDGFGYFLPYSSKADVTLASSNNLTGYLPPMTTPPTIFASFIDCFNSINRTNKFKSSNFASTPLGFTTLTDAQQLRIYQQTTAIYEKQHRANYHDELILRFPSIDLNRDIIQPTSEQYQQLSSSAYGKLPTAGVKLAPSMLGMLGHVSAPSRSAAMSDIYSVPPSGSAAMPRSAAMFDIYSAPPPGSAAMPRSAAMPGGRRYYYKKSKHGTRSNHTKRTKRSKHTKRTKRSKRTTKKHRK
jgi:hypothetical protein